MIALLATTIGFEILVVLILHVFAKKAAQNVRTLLDGLNQRMFEIDSLKASGQITAAEEQKRKLAVQAELDTAALREGRFYFLLHFAKIGALVMVLLFSAFMLLKMTVTHAGAFLAFKNAVVITAETAVLFALFDSILFVSGEVSKNSVA